MTVVLSAVEEQLGDEQVVPHPEELERRERRDGRDRHRGTTSLQNVWKWLHPSILADSTTLRGSVLM